MQKLVYILWPSPGQSIQPVPAQLLQECAPALLSLGVSKLTMNIDDEYSTVKSPAPKMHCGPGICAQVSVWLEDINRHVEVEKILALTQMHLAGYLVEESVYKDYGDNRHSGPRNWPDGQRSPGVMAITLLTKPKRYSREEWIRRWHGVMSPESEKIQPRQRYVRNVIIKPVTENAPAYDGIVEEAWPSPEHITNPYLFYCADNPLQLVAHLYRMLRAILHFHNLFRIRTVTMSEYFIKS